VSRCLNRSSDLSGWWSVQPIFFQFPPRMLQTRNRSVWIRSDRSSSKFFSLVTVGNYSSVSAAAVFLLFGLVSGLDCHVVDSHFAEW